MSARAARHGDGRDAPSVRNRRRPPGRRACLVGLALLPAALAAPGCRSAPPPRQVAQAALVLRVDGPAPLCYIDDQPVQLHPGGTRVTLPGGPHRVEVRAPGHFTAYREVTVPPGGRAELAVRLRPDPDADLLPPPKASPVPTPEDPR